MSNNLNQFSCKSSSGADVSGGSLGIYVKSRATENEQNDSEHYVTSQKLIKRFSLLWKSKRILKGVASKSVLGCMRTTMQEFVELHKTDGHANFKGVVTCKSKHVCPVESPSIASVEAKYIGEAIRKCCAEGNEPYMLTLTARHDKSMSLAYCMKSMHDASQVFWRSGSVRRFFDTFFFGRITALEETWSSATGWHVHYHILLFGERGLLSNPFCDIGAFFSRQWLHALERVGLSGVDGVASNFQGASAVKNYLTKMPLEITMQNFKEGRAGGLNPFGILQASNEHDIYAEKWREYYLATKGKRVIVWSDGLKARYGIADKTDEEIAEEANNDILDALERVIIYVDSDDWRQKVCSDSYNLAYLKSCGVLDVLPFLEVLGVQYATDYDIYDG